MTKHDKIVHLFFHSLSPRYYKNIITLKATLKQYKKPT